MIVIEDKENCCGCYACYNICPHHAIKMEKDSRGFRYPTIDKEKCIKCGLCKEVCEKSNKAIIKNTPSAYACYNKNEKIRLESSSGGIFSLISEYILSNDGVVFGAAFDGKFEVNHTKIESINELAQLRSSKYVQSNINDTYKEAKKQLEQGKLVLFSGTPCQINGLKKFLNKEYDNLFLQDIICHGVPSPKVWKNYLKFREDTDKDKIKQINFRQKDNGWNNYEVVISYYDNEYRIHHNNDIYMKAFLNNVSLRESCYNCKSKGNNRFSDITLADFWGINNVIPDFNDEKGCSLIIINTTKGNALFQHIKDKIVYENVNYEDGIKYNPSYYQSATESKLVDKFFENLDKLEFDKLVDRYTVDNNPNFIKRILRKGKKIIKKLLKK